MGAVDVHTIDTGAGGQHQAVVSVQFGELALADLHAQHDALAHCVVNVGTDERQPRLTAHTAGAFKRHITMQAGAKVQAYALGAEHRPGLLLADTLFFIGGVAVKDACEVHIKNRVRQVGNQFPVTGFGVIVATQDAHGLEEQRIGILLVGGRSASAFFCCRCAEIKRIPILCFHSVTHHRPGRQLENLISGLGHILTSRQSYFTTHK